MLVDELLARLGQTKWLTTGTVLEVRPGAVLVQLDVDAGDEQAAADPGRLVLATAASDEDLAPGAHVLVEYVRDGRLVHGRIPADLVLPVTHEE